MSRNVFLRGLRGYFFLFCLSGFLMIFIKSYMRNVKFLKNHKGFVYTPEFNKSLHGSPLLVSKKHLDNIGFPRTTFYNASMSTWTDFVFATAASADHFDESLDCVASMQNYMPGHLIYYYGLGMKPSQVARVKKFCGVIFKRFNFERYPPHVSNLKNYAFKPLIIQDVMRHAKGVLWMDSSTRLTSGDFSNVYEQLQKNGGFLTFISSKHSIFGVTRPLVYNYLPSDYPRLKHLTQKSAGAILAYNTDIVWNNILKWFYLCSLVKDCINPKNTGPHCTNRLLILVFSKARKYNTFTGCYRYDQSIITLLAANHYNFDGPSHFLKKPVLRRWRKGWFPKNLSRLKVCNTEKETNIIKK